MLTPQLSKALEQIASRIGVIPIVTAVVDHYFIT